MTIRTATKVFLLPAAAAIGVVVVALHYGRGSAVGLGAVLVGVAAVAEAYTRATRADRKVEHLARRVNGGLEQAARKVMQEDEVIAGILHRMDRFEAERDVCIEDRRQLHERLIAAIGHVPGGEQE